jgi:hypothetical protein
VVIDAVDRVADMAASDAALCDGAALCVARALAGLDPATGDPLPVALPRRMTRRGWRPYVTLPPYIQVGSYAGWWTRCTRKNCEWWAGPFLHEEMACEHARVTHRHRSGR